MLSFEAFRWKYPWILVLICLLLPAAGSDSRAQTARGGETGVSPAPHPPAGQGAARRSDSPARDAAAASAPTPVPTPVLPLYKRYPPELVVVAEVGDAYILTRKDLERMVGNPVPPGVLAQRDSDEFMAAEAERQLSRAEEEVLWDWALVKTIALLAKQDGMEITDRELDAHLANLEKQLEFPVAGDGFSARIVDPQTFRKEMRDALLVDKAILMQVKGMIPEEQRREIYRRNPALYSAPAAMRVWHIYKIIPFGASDKEIRDIRGEFYKVRQQAARSGGRDFEKVALENNPQIGGKPNNGDMGWIDENTNLEDETMQTLRKLKIGEVSGVVHVKTEAKVTGGSIMDLFQSQGRPQPAIESPGSFQIYRVTEREEAKGQTYDEYAQKRVLDALVEEFKLKMGRPIMRAAPFPVRLNATGLRLINEPGR